MFKADESSSVDWRRSTRSETTTAITTARKTKVECWLFDTWKTRCSAPPRPRPRRRRHRHRRLVAGFRGHRRGWLRGSSTVGWGRLCWKITPPRGSSSSVWNRIRARSMQSVVNAVSWIAPFAETLSYHRQLWGLLTHTSVLPTPCNTH